MSIEEVLSKLSTVEGISPEDISSLKELITKKDSPNASNSEREIKEAKAAQSRILEEKKALQQKVREYEEQLESIKTGGLTEQEKLKKEMEKLLKTKETIEKELNESKNTMVKLQRDYKLEKIRGKIKYLDTIPEDLRKYSVENAFKEVENLDDEKEVESVLKSYTDAYKGIIASDSTARGSGDKTKDKIDIHKNSENLTADERAAQLREKQKLGRI